ncbi:AmmeMemoRadiSam system protein B [Desulfonatronum thioautotrophicum]|uniref:AmmeMemoRadiSam system protein B n=1 Tax=Desulfonatronum thioautotrophicum TaxID=617001 RepID=UPI0005EADF1F|nr:AmmeMemoRadiSam system protein B [Desulfonatronum thioautotrophicum]
MDRNPVVAGKFYPGTQQAWEAEVRGLLPPADTAHKAYLAMLPHAGYMYSGAIAGKTLAEVHVPETVLLLGPNHTGQGSPLALWPEGRWLLPGAHLDVDATLAQHILEAIPEIQADHQAHLQEHSLEVILPFLWAIQPQTKIVPLAVAEPRLDVLQHTAQELAKVLKKWPSPVLILVSSDMSHFVSADQAKEKDTLALQAALARTPEKLYATVRDERISMCGMLPMVLGLSTANQLGASHARLIAYGTSGDVTGEFSQVVGYAGVVVE